MIIHENLFLNNIIIFYIYLVQSFINICVYQKLVICYIIKQFYLIFTFCGQITWKNLDDFVDTKRYSSNLIPFTKNVCQVAEMFDFAAWHHDGF